MKTILPSLFFVLLLPTTAVFSQDPTDSPAHEVLANVFSSGTMIGQSSETITNSNLLGRPNTQIFQGRYNVPDAVRYWESLQGVNPYLTEVGYFGKGKHAAYFLLSKLSNVRGQEFSDAEVESALYRFAKGGKWTTKASTGVDYKGTFYEYTHDYQIENAGQKILRTFRLFAYRIQSKYSLIIYSPIVAVELDGTSAAPAVRLAFADGVQRDLAGVHIEGQPFQVVYFDQDAPADIANSAPENLEPLTAFLQKGDTSGKSYQFSSEEFAEFTNLRMSEGLIKQAGPNFQANRKMIGQAAISQFAARLAESPSGDAALKIVDNRLSQLLKRSQSKGKSDFSEAQPNP